MALRYQPRDVFLVRQNVRILLYERGRLLKEIQAHNLVPDTGLDHIADLVRYPDDDIAERGANPTYIAVGIGTTAAAAGDTALESEIYRAEISYRLPQTNGIEWQLYLPPEEANDYTLTEAGLFQSLVGGTLLGRVVHDPIEKDESVSVTYRWTWTLSNA